MIPRYDFIALMPTMPREALYERINSRVDNMMSCGLTSEVKGLIESGVTPDDQCMQGIGYKETVEAILSGTKVATELIKMNTRRYAKRQITFFKRFQNLYPIDFTSDDKIEKTFKIVNEFLNF